MPAQVATTADLEALAQEITALRRELEALRAQVQAPPRFVRLKDAARELDRSESFLPARFREIRKTSPGLELPIPLAYLPGAYYLEQAIHAMLWPFRIRWIGSGKTEWFLGLPGVVGLVVYIIQSA